MIGKLRSKKNAAMAGCVLALGIGAAGLLAVGMGMVALLAMRAVDYPGGEPMAEHTMLSGLPAPGIRRVTSYRTTDDFVKVYNWYSAGFSMGAEQHAQGNCSQLFKSQTGLLASQTMGVTICDTPNGRLVFVQLALFLRIRGPGFWAKNR